jgi:hypothetical protein
VRPGLLAAVASSALVLAGCGGSSSAPEAQRDQGPTRTPSSSSHPPRTPFVPRTATARLAAWRLPVASARQALVPLGGGRVLLAGGLRAGDVSTGAVTQVDLTTGRTTPEPPLAVPVHDVAGGLAGGAPLVVGGGNATEQDVVQARQGQGWRVVGHLPTTRSDLGVVTVGGHAYVVGGYDGTGTPTQILSLDAHGRSRAVGHLVRGVRYAATALVGRTAYVLGGEVLGQELPTVQRVDLTTGRTRVVARLPVPIGHAAAAAVGDRILLLGGRTSPDRQTSAMWWFDPVSRSFTPAGHLPFAVSDAAVASYRHDVWLLGGEDPSVTDRVAFVRVR